MSKMKTLQLISIFLSSLMASELLAESENKVILECKQIVRDSAYINISCLQVLLSDKHMDNTDRAWLYYSLGYAYQEGEKNDKLAIYQYTEAIKLNVSEQITFSSYINRANSYLKLCDIVNASQDLEAAKKIWPNHATINNLKAEIDNEKCNKP